MSEPLLNHKNQASSNSIRTDTDESYNDITNLISTIKFIVSKPEKIDYPLSIKAFYDSSRLLKGSDISEENTVLVKAIIDILENLLNSQIQSLEEINPKLLSSCARGDQAAIVRLSTKSKDTITIMKDLFHHLNTILSPIKPIFSAVAMSKDFIDYFNAYITSNFIIPQNDIICKIIFYLYKNAIKLGIHDMSDAPFLDIYMTSSQNEMMFRKSFIDLVKVQDSFDISHTNQSSIINLYNDIKVHSKLINSIVGKNISASKSIYNTSSYDYISAIFGNLFSKAYNNLLDDTVSMFEELFISNNPNIEEIKVLSELLSLNFESVDTDSFFSEAVSSAWERVLEHDKNSDKDKIEQMDHYIQWFKTISESFAAGPRISSIEKQALASVAEYHKSELSVELAFRWNDYLKNFNITGDFSLPLCYTEILKSLGETKLFVNTYIRLLCERLIGSQPRLDFEDFSLQQISKICGEKMVERMKEMINTVKKASINDQHVYKIIFAIENEFPPSYAVNDITGTNLIEFIDKQSSETFENFVLEQSRIYKKMPYEIISAIDDVIVTDRSNRQDYHDKTYLDVGLSIAKLELSVESGVFTIICSGYQALIIMAILEHPLTIDEISTKSAIKKEDLHDEINRLIETKVLIKSSDSFAINEHLDPAKSVLRTRSFKCAEIGADDVKKACDFAVISCIAYLLSTKYDRECNFDKIYEEALAILNETHRLSIEHLDKDVIRKTSKSYLSFSDDESTIKLKRSK